MQKMRNKHEHFKHLLSDCIKLQQTILMQSLQRVYKEYINVLSEYLYSTKQQIDIIAGIYLTGVHGISSLWMFNTFQGMIAIIIEEKTKWKLQCKIIDYEIGNFNRFWCQRNSPNWEVSSLSQWDQHLMNDKEGNCCCATCTFVVAKKKTNIHIRSLILLQLKLALFTCKNVHSGIRQQKGESLLKFQVTG